MTYGIFSLAFIALATAAWFFKGSEFLPKYTLLKANIENADIKTEPNDKKIVARKEYKNNKPVSNNLTDLSTIDELQDKVKRVKDEMQQLNAELDTIRIKQYIASAQHLINTRASPEQALSILQSARTHIKSHPNTPDTDMNALSQDIEYQITQLQQYIVHSPNQALPLLRPLIDHLHTKLETTLKPLAEENTHTAQTDNSQIQKWLNKIYAAGKSLIKVQHQDYQYIENNRLLLKLLIVARSAILLNEQEQFNIALQDALRLIDTMPKPPISQKQIKSILSLEITWQLPQMQQ